MSYIGLSKKNLKEYTKKIINKIGVCKSLKEKYPKEFDFFVNYLFKRHPKYPEKINGLVDVLIKYNKFGNLSVYFKKKNDTVEDISALNKCINGKNKDDLYIAMRTSILPQILKFRKKLPNLICEICNSSNNIEIDHKEPQFIELFSNFINEQKYKPNKFSSNKYHQKTFRKKDLNFKKKMEKIS